MPLHRPLLIAALLLACAAGQAEDPFQGHWTEAQAREVLDRTLRIRLAPPLDHLHEAERAALVHLLKAGRLLHGLYLEQTHAEALSARRSLQDLHARSPDRAHSAALLDLFRLAKGPVITSLRNRREPFLPVAAERASRNVYPADLGTNELQRFLDAHPDQRAALLAPRAIVRRRPLPDDRYLQDLARWPVLDALHPGLAERLRDAAAPDGPVGFLAVPYALEYAATLMAVFEALDAAATSVETVDQDFADYLRHRARDLLVNDYEAGDAAWVTGRYANLNAQIGSYETYDDKLFGTKTFFGMSLLARDAERSRRLAGALDVIQEVENSLPYDRPKRVRESLPVGVYNVVADFGQARGGNTATILPNDPDHARRYGRIILLRYNIMTQPELFENRRLRFVAATKDAFHGHLSSDARFNRTLFHEIGHYLGVDRTADGRDLGLALGRHSDLLEELKADLASLYAVPALRASGYYADDDARSVYAAGVSRTLQVVKPRRKQPYQTMQLMQFNYFVENGVLRADGPDRRLDIDYSRYPATVAAMLREVLALQDAGDVERAQAYIERWAYWKDDLHGTLAARLRNAIAYRYTLIHYDAID